MGLFNFFKADKEQIKKYNKFKINELLKLAEDNFKNYNWSSAVNFCNKAVEIDKDSIKAIYLRGISNIELNNFEEALTDFSRIIELNNEEILAYCKRAKLYENQEKFILSKRDYELVYELLNKPPKTVIKYSNQDIFFYYLDFGFLCKRLNEYKKAINYFNNAIEKADKNTNAFVNALVGRADAKFQIRDFAGAIEDANTALEINKFNISARKILKKIQSNMD